MSDDPFLAELKERARASTRLPKAAQADGAGASGEAGTALAFWQSDTARAFIDERISGAAGQSPADVFAEFVDEPLRSGTGLSLRAGDPSVECELVRKHVCRTMTIVDSSAERVDYARARVPDDLRDSVALENRELLELSPSGPVSMVVVRSVLHRSPDPAALLSRISDWLTPGGMVYVDEFVGPDRFQWTDRQIEIVNRLLASLPGELRRDLTAGGETTKNLVGRPDSERFARDHPAEAIAGSRIREALDSHFEAVAVRPYGGAIFHQLFARIMGNFATRPELVRVLLEFDAILTDLGVVESDYLWAAYRKPA